MAGLIVKDATGRQILDMTTRISRSVGSFNTGTGNGSVAVGFPGGTPWFVRVPDGSTGRKGKGPAVVLSGNVFSWSFSYASGLGEYPVSATIYYGVR